MLSKAGRKWKILVSGLLVALMALMVTIAGCGEDGAEKPPTDDVEKQKTSILGQAPGAVREIFNDAILEHFPEKTGHEVTATFRGCFDSSDDFWAGANDEQLKANVLIAYGRTGELPEGTDIYAAWEASRPLLEPMPGHFTVRPELAALVDTQGHFQVPYFDTMVIIYNPALIERKNVPKSWAELADFDGTIAVPAWGCFGMRTLTYLYNIVGEEKFEHLIASGKVPPLVLSRDDPREKPAKPLAAGCAVKAVLGEETELREGLGVDVPVGIGSLQRAELRQGLEDGTLGVVWPEEGAMAFPYLVAVQKNPTAADLALLDFWAQDETMRGIVFEGGFNSALVDGPVHPIIEENNFHYKFMPLEDLMDKATHQKIIEIVAHGGCNGHDQEAASSTCKCCGGH
jgi:ABC-type Fe3+ transport system substrate-binding protein/predicted small lipoprotein YifL